VRGEARGLYRGLVHTFVKKSRFLRDRVFPAEFGSKLIGERGRAPPGGARVSAGERRGPATGQRREGGGEGTRAGLAAGPKASWAAGEEAGQGREGRSKWAAATGPGRDQAGFFLLFFFFFFVFFSKTFSE